MPHLNRFLSVSVKLLCAKLVMIPNCLLTMLKKRFPICLIQQESKKRLLNSKSIDFLCCNDEMLSKLMILYVVTNKSWGKNSLAYHADKSPISLTWYPKHHICRWVHLCRERGRAGGPLTHDVQIMWLVKKLETIQVPLYTGFLGFGGPKKYGWMDEKSTWCFT